MKDADYLVVGQVFEKFGMCKQVLAVTIDENTFLDGCVQWCHPGCKEVHAMWLPLWLKWARTATKMPQRSPHAGHTKKLKEIE